MFCRRAWQRVGPLVRRALIPASGTAPVRHMALGVPGGSSNMAYLVLCGGGLTAAAVYAYKTVNSDSEHHEDQLASVDSTAKAPEAAAPEAAAPEAAPEAAAAPTDAPAPVEEAAPATEVVDELVPASAEQVAETAAEPVVETTCEEVAAVASEVAAAEAGVDSAVAEETAPAAAVEAAAEAAPDSVEAIALEEMPAEAPVADAPTAESAESTPAVKILAGSTVEIAAASVCEMRLVEVVQKMEEDGKDLDSTLEVMEPEVMEAKETAVEAAAVVNEEHLKSVDAGADAEASAAEEEEGEAAVSPSEEPTAPALTVEEGGEAGDQAPVPGIAPEDAISSTEASPEDVAPTEEATITAEATSVEETSVGEAAEETVGAAAVVVSVPLAAASFGSDLEVISAESECPSEAPVHEAKHCHSCHSAPPAAEEVVPPAALGEQLASEGAVDVTHEASEAAVSLEEQTATETLMVVTTQS